MSSPPVPSCSPQVSDTVGFASFCDKLRAMPKQVGPWGAAVTALRETWRGPKGERLSQAELARKAKIAPNTIGAIEKGGPTQSRNFFKLADFFGVPVTTILGFPDFPLHNIETLAHDVASSSSIPVPEAAHHGPHVSESAAAARTYVLTQSDLDRIGQAAGEAAAVAVRVSQRRRSTPSARARKSSKRPRRRRNA